MERVIPRRHALRLYCLPFATGSASVYRDWTRWFPPSVEVRPLDYPGHGRRFGQRPLCSIHQIAQVFATEIARDLDVPFVVFGHSMGALVGIELARELRRRRAPLPLKIYASASPPPVNFRTARGSDVSAMPDERLRERLRRLGGTPAEMLDNDELMQVMMPIARADLIACSDYVHRPEPPLPCSVTALGGVEDHTFDQSHLARWREATSAEFDVAWMPGGHFFLHTHSSQLMQWLRDDLRSVFPAAF